jgi:mersacidin/lichenicidin family type 2 lantibiotic
MSAHNIIRAWKDPAYRRSLTAAERARLPAHPSGAIEFQDLDTVYGSISPHTKSPCKKCASGGASW